MMRDHYHPRPSIIVQRYTFNSRSRKEGESIAMYVAELKKLSMECEYGDSLNEMIRDRLVCGVNDGRIQRLLAEPDLTFKKAMEIAQAIEAADKNVQEIQGSAARDQHVHALWKGYLTSHSMQKSADTVEREITWRKIVGLRRPSVVNARRKDTLQQFARISNG